MEESEYKSYKCEELLLSFIDANVPDGSGIGNIICEIKCGWLFFSFKLMLEVYVRKICHIPPT